ncbi:MAG: MerR family transcriptional regulator [Candidatus Melainabacteria bacterium]|nr:MerR family transcriptional regulator [Candidatus Melainabacteria bacterium]
MRQSTSGSGTKIAQAAQELNVTSVTIRRYIAEFNIETSADENGVKVLPKLAMEELKEIRRLKEEGLTNPKVMELLEEQRTKQKPAKAKSKERSVKEQAEAIHATEAKELATRRVAKEAEPAVVEEEAPAAAGPESEETTDSTAELTASVRSKHSLTCQTCGKVFEHMNPRLRDCLDCYRTKRRERRRGGSERHKNVIQHPLAQQVAIKSEQHVHQQYTESTTVIQRQSVVRNYRKATEETRLITANLKRRLERPDLPEGERRWLEQIYAYQLILHQGWRHLSEYKSATQAQSRSEHPEA